MSSSAEYTRLAGANGVIFQVIPADAPRFWPLIGVGVLVFLTSFIGFSILLATLAAIVCIVLGTADLRPLDHRTSARFRVRAAGIDALGESFAGVSADDVSIGNDVTGDDDVLGRVATFINRYQQLPIGAVTRSLRLRSAHRNLVLAGGLDATTASALLSDVQDTVRTGRSGSVSGEAPLADAITAGRAAVGLIAIDIWAATGAVLADEQKLYVLTPADMVVDVTDEAAFATMKQGDQVSLFWGLRRGANVHVIDGVDRRSLQIEKGGQPWGSVSQILTVVNHSSGASAMIPEPYNRMVVPNRRLYVFMGIVAIFAGVGGAVAFFSGAPSGIIFPPLAIGFFVWMRRRQGVLATAIQSAAAKLKQTVSAGP